ncbi:MAG: carboxy terminal-processing peptidase [Calditrichaceae bacterium]|nr:carboxy terminal-processing peptidase [Calditrichaceae bacterium]MBN2710707.1 carboxy terminal-processing peptidase [Calditrichaceae bacterium]RQV92736.1 MAG: tail-specific protease [Calditrichota bacterium]
MKKILLLIFAAAVLISVYPVPGGDKNEAEQLAYKIQQAEPQHGRVSQIVMKILSNSHYQKKPIDDSLSAQMFEEYLSTLDYNRIYFLLSDIKEFEQYKYQLDDYLKAGNASPAFDIFNRFQTRFAERQEFIFSLLQKEFDYSIDEYYQPDRSEAEWVETGIQQDSIWRKMIKNEALKLHLAGKDWDGIAETLEKRYKNLERNIKQTENEDVFQWYMNAFAVSFDPHTNYMSPKISDDFKIKMSLSLEGIGASLRTENEYTKVVEIVPGGPADKSGLLHANDLITAVAQGEEGELVDVIGWRIDDVVQIIRGPKDTKVRLQIIKADAALDAPQEIITIVRDKVKLEDRAAKSDTLELQHRGKSYKLGIIEIPTFYFDYEAMRKGDPDYKSTTRDVERLLRELQSAGVDGIVIDLRNNSGGFLNEAIELTGLFIKSGPVVQVRAANGQVKIESDYSGNVVYDGPMAVLMNRFSASASEIFAAAIQDYGRGIILGSQSFGKGTVQNIIELDRFFPNKGADNQKYGQIKMTIAKFYRVNGGSTQHLGVTPDISFPSQYELMDIGENAEPNALKWDEINAAQYMPVNPELKQYIPRLKKLHLSRIKDDFEFQYIMEDIEEFKQQKEIKMVSLEENKRRLEREKAEERKKNRKEQRDKDEAENGKKEADALILESGRILLDMKLIAMG